MPRWVEHQSDEEAGSSSDEDETAIARQQQDAQREQQQKRKADTPGPSTQKKLKLSISLNKSKLECHVSTLSLLYSLARISEHLSSGTLAAGVWPKGSQRRICGICIPRLPQQALLLMQAAGAHYNDMPI